MVIGKPIPVPRHVEGKEDSGVSCTSNVPPRPDESESGRPDGSAKIEANPVDVALKQFVTEMERIYYKHREAYSDNSKEPLTVL